MLRFRAQAAWQATWQPIWRLLGILGLSLLLAGCGNAVPTPTPNTTAGLSIATAEPPPPNAERNGRAWGPADAPLKVVKFVDYQCPNCGRLTRDYDPAIVEAFAATNNVRMEVHMLTFIGRESYVAALAALCAADQDMFWRMHRSIFLNQPFDGRENTGLFKKPQLKVLAAQMGLDMATFDACLDSEMHGDALEQDRKLAQQYGVAAVPTFVVNGKVYTGIRTAEDLVQIFKELAPNVSFNPPSN